MKVVNNGEVKRFDDFVTKGFKKETNTKRDESYHADKKESFVQTKNQASLPI